MPLELPLGVGSQSQRPFVTPNFVKPVILTAKIVLVTPKPVILNGNSRFFTSKPVILTGLKVQEVTNERKRGNEEKNGQSHEPRTRLDSPKVPPNLVNPRKRQRTLLCP